MQPQMPQKHIPKSCSVAEKFSDRVIRAASNQLIKVINRLQSTEVRGSTVCRVCLRESSHNEERGGWVLCAKHLEPLRLRLGQFELEGA
jgi:hypothetical protein